MRQRRGAVQPFLLPLPRWEGLGEGEQASRREPLRDRKLFEPGDLVVSFTGQIGLVLSPEEYEQAKARFREGRRPGHYFAPGCCANPDYVTQVPVLFEDGMYDVMKTMNIRKKSDVQEEKQDQIQKMFRV
jgi:hypothetical protein